MYTFLFASLAFAYFYLKSNNSGKLWRPDGITAPTGIGWAIFAVVLASVLLDHLRAVADAIGLHTRLGGERMGCRRRASCWPSVSRSGSSPQLPFFPGSSGYASCFIGWAVMNIMMLVGGAYWLETNLALCLRLERLDSEEGSPATATGPAAQLFRANVESCTYFFGFMAVISALFWVFFYLI